MGQRNNFWLIAGGMNIFSALVHTILGQITLVKPLLQSTIEHQEITEWLGVWHIVTVVLFASSYYLIRQGLHQRQNRNLALIEFIAYLYLLFSFVFIALSIINNVFAPQWVLLLPIALFALAGINKERKYTPALSLTS